MPPRVPSNRGGKKTVQIQPPRVPPTGSARRQRVPNLPAPEPAPIDPVPIEPEATPKRTSWLDNLPEIFDPDREIHTQLSIERRQKEERKIMNYCRCELDGIFNYAMLTRNLIKLPNFEETRTYRRVRNQFRNGILTPEAAKNTETNETDGFQTVLAPTHSLEVHHYLHFQSDSILSDLSNVFGVTLSDQKLGDPNPAFAKMLETLQSGMKIFMSPYKPFDRIAFPFIICIVGPQASGKTTVCQLIQTAFDVHVIDCVSVPGESKKGGKMNRTTTMDSIEAVDDAPPDYPLIDAIQIKYSDDKTAIAQIVAAVKERQEDGKGFVISGFPTQKNQLAALEKAMVAAGANMQAQQAAFLRTMARGRAAQPSINGVIFTVYSEPSRERTIDPETGFIYKPGFHMPGTADFIGVPPIQFSEKKAEIENRLEGYLANEYQVLAPKQLQQYVQFEQQVKKTIPAVSIGLCETSYQMMQYVDTFMCELYKNNLNYLPNHTPLVSLMKPRTLVKPSKCFTAIKTWYRCLETFGKAIADQSNLVSTLSDKLDVLMKAATERYQLLIAKRDDRIKLCNDFMAGDKKELSAHFRTIWELSIAIRNQNFEFIDDVVDKSGLIELLLELRKSSKIVFIALVHRLAFVSWFSSKFGYLCKNEPEQSSGAEKLDVVTAVPLPEVNYQLLNPVLLAASMSQSNSLELTESNKKLPQLDLSNISPFMSLSNLPSEPKTARVPRPGGTGSRKCTPLTARRDEKEDRKERKQMAGIRGFDYLMENMSNLSERPQDSIHFDAQKACAELDVVAFEPKHLNFEDTIPYASAFWDHLEHELSDPMLIKEVKSSRAIFNKFTTLCHRKEAAMVNSVFDLRDSLTTYTYAKCTHEMETFSRRFRIIKQGGSLDGHEPFEYDIASASKSIQGLAELMVSMNTPVTIQSLVSLDTIQKLATKAADLGKQFANIDEFMELTRACGLEETEIEEIELCLRVCECVECFDIQKFLLLFPRTREDEMKLMRIFSRGQKKPVNGNQLSDVSANEDPEEEEDARISDEENTDANDM